MPDVNVSVVIDGKPVFVHGAAGAPNGQASAVGGLQVALRHFQDILASRVPPPGAKPQDTSL
jgi:hypothetical protein